MNKKLLIEALGNAPGILRDLVDSAPAEKLKASPREGVWTIFEHIHHLAMTQIMLGRRVQSFLTDPHPTIVPFVPEGDSAPKNTDKTVDELLQKYDTHRQKQISDIRTASEDVWKKTAVHPEYEIYGFDILVRHILLHDFFHIYRIEELAFLKPENIADL